jgi:uncharacterized membrane protein
MPKIAITFGTLLIIEGLAFYFGTGTKSITALIPAFAGLPILILGLVGLVDSLRKHAMHAAAALGLLGVLAPLVRMSSAGLSRSAATASQVIMLLLCAAFLALCIKSFVDARRRQRASASGE